jgi:hypothetical protein
LVASTRKRCEACPKPLTEPRYTGSVLDVTPRPYSYYLALAAAREITNR